VHRAATPDFSKITIPEMDCRDSSVADILAFLIERVADENPNAPFRPSLVDRDTANRETAERDRKFQRLRNYCDGKLITLRVQDCSILNLIDFVSRYAGVKYELQGYKLIIKSPDGEVLASL